MQKNSLRQIPRKQIIYEENFSIDQVSFNSHNILSLDKSNINKNSNASNSNNSQNLSQLKINPLLIIKKNLIIHNCFEAKYYNKLMINCLIFKKKSHILTVFNEIKLSFNNKNILKRYYTLTECECRISRFENYYKHYLKYLLKPILRNYYFNNLIHERANQKAQNYFNLAYGNKRVNNNNNNINNNEKDQINDIIIFNDTIKETIENYSTTITCESKEQLIYPSEIYKKCLEDNKMHNSNSLIINRINNNFSESEILLNSNKSNFIIQNDNDSIINMLKFLTKKKNNNNNSNKKIIKQKSINNILEKPEINKRKAISKSNPKKIKRFSNDKNDRYSLREKSKRKKENDKNNAVNNYNNIKSNNNNQKNINNNIKEINNYSNKDHNKNKEINNNIKQKNKNEVQNSNINSKKISFISSIPTDLNLESKKLNLIKKVKKNYNKSLSNTIEMKKNIIKYQNIQKSNIDNLLNNNNNNNNNFINNYNNNPSNIIYNQYNKNSVSTRFQKHSNISGEIISNKTNIINKTNNNNNNLNLNCYTTVYLLNKRRLSALKEKKKTFSKSLIKITKDKLRNNNNYFNSFNFNLTEGKKKHNNNNNNNNDNDSLFLKHKKIQTAPNITNDDNNNLYKSSQFQKIKHNNIKTNISNSNLHYYHKLKKEKHFFHNNNK